MSLVIVYNGYGETSLYAGTQANAISILNMFIDDNFIPEEVMKLVNNTESYIVVDKLLTQALEEVVDTPVEQPLPKLRRLLYGAVKKGEEEARPVVNNSTEYKQEIALWLMENNKNSSYFKNLSYYELEKSSLVNDLSFLKAFKDRITKPIIWTCNEYLDSADQIKVILKNRWKEGTTEEQIVRYIVRTISEFGGRDNQISIEQVKDTFN